MFINLPTIFNQFVLFFSHGNSVVTNDVSKERGGVAWENVTHLTPPSICALVLLILNFLRLHTQSYPHTLSFQEERIGRDSHFIGGNHETSSSD